MFGQSNWKEEFAHKIDQLELKLEDLEKQQAELRGQNSRLNHSLKSVTRKLVMRLPLSLESLEKGLRYDLIFPEEMEAWRSMAQDGVVLDLRPADEFAASCIPGAISVPLERLEAVMQDIPKTKPLLLVCENGVRSVSASEVLAQKAFHFIYVLKGGMSHYVGNLEAGQFSQEELSGHA